jgi:hypothetical protein
LDIESIPNDHDVARASFIRNIGVEKMLVDRGRVRHHIFDGCTLKLAKEYSPAGDRDVSAIIFMANISNDSITPTSSQVEETHTLTQTLNSFDKLCNGSRLSGIPVILFLTEHISSPREITSKSSRLPFKRMSDDPTYTPTQEDMIRLFGALNGSADIMTLWFHFSSGKQARNSKFFSWAMKQVVLCEDVMNSGLWLRW